MSTQVLDKKGEKAGLPLATDRWQWSQYTNAANLRVLVLALTSFAVGTGVYAVLSPVLVAATGLGAVLGSLVLEHASSASLGRAGDACAAVALILSVLGSRFSDRDEIDSAA